MVAWDNPRGIYQWFHWEYLELDTPPAYVRTYIKNLLLPRLPQPAVDFGIIAMPIDWVHSGMEIRYTHIIFSC